MIDEQKGVVFEDDDYDKIQKVYSLWFIRDDTKSHTNREIDHVLNNCIQVSYIYIHDPRTAPKGSLIRLSGAILSDTMSIVEKIKILEEEFCIRLFEVKEGVIRMCTLGRSIAIKNEMIGEEKANRDTTSRLFQLGRPIEEIAIAVDVTVETVRKWLEEAGLVTKA